MNEYQRSCMIFSNYVISKSAASVPLKVSSQRHNQETKKPTRDDKIIPLQSLCSTLEMSAAVQ